MKQLTAAKVYPAEERCPSSHLEAAYAKCMHGAAVSESDDFKVVSNSYELYLEYTHQIIKLLCFWMTNIPQFDIQLQRVSTQFNVR